MKVVAVLLLTLLVVTDIDSTSARRKSKSSDKPSKDEVDDMICPPCDRLFCTVRKASKLKCKGGVTTDICGCCPVCAKQLGEPCGGEWNYLGKCDDGLMCQSTSSFRPPFQQSVMKTEIPRNRLPEGVCVEGKKTEPFITLDDPELYSGQEHDEEHPQNLFLDTKQVFPH